MLPLMLLFVYCVSGLWAGPLQQLGVYDGSDGGDGGGDCKDPVKSV